MNLSASQRQLTAGIVQDPFYANNFATVSNTTRHWFDAAWNFTTTFSRPPGSTGVDRVTLLFKGLNYKANVTLNGHFLGSLVGTFRYFALDITALLQDSNNALQVLVSRPHDECFPPDNNTTDLANSFIDWAPPPPDANLGLQDEVLLRVTGPVRLSSPLVVVTVLDANPDTICLDVAFDVAVFEASVVASIVLNVPSLSVQVQATQQLLAGSDTVWLNCSTYSALRVVVPSSLWWWPHGFGAPILHLMNITVSRVDQLAEATALSDTLVNVPFGLRMVDSRLDALGHRLFYVNGRPFQVRGAGWTPDLFLADDADSLKAHFVLMTDLGLNTIRLEGKMPPDVFFDLADTYGIMVMVGWACCDAWQHWADWQPTQYAIAAASMHTQLGRLRIHPSILVFLYGSDEAPPMEVEELYLQVALNRSWPNPLLASAAATTSNISGSTGVKMSGPCKAT